MRYVRLGKTDLTVSRIALGTWAFGGEWGPFDRGEAKGAVHCALELGINFFDTAQAYGFGVSEKVLAEALWPRVCRDQVTVATKGGLRMEGAKTLRDASAGWLRRGVESSLRNLRTDYIDLYQVHWPDLHTPAEETAGVLEELVGEGKIRHVGVSNYGTQQMEELAHHGRLETLQPPYHMFRREIEVEVLPYASRNDMGVLVYGPLAHGMLSGSLTPDTTFLEGDWRRYNPDFTGETFRRNLLVAARLKDYAEGWGITLPQLAVAWTLSHPSVHVALVGARRASQLDETAAAGDIELSEADRHEIDTILAGAAPLVGPSPEGV